jgi:PAS domain S-box-containing protein
MPAVPYNAPRGVVCLSWMDQRLTHQPLIAGALLANVPGAIYRSDWDHDYAILLITDEVERISGYPREAFVVDRTRTINDMIHPDDLPSVMDEARAAAREGRPFAIEYRIVRADGTICWVLDRGQLVHGPAGETWMDGVMFDMTERRAAEAQLRRREAEAARTEELRASRARVVAAADAARRRIERDLHDGAQQQLVAVALGLRVAQGKLAGDPAAAAPILAEAIDRLAHAIAELRELARGIHPAVLTDHGLVPAVEALAARAPLPVDLTEMPGDRLPAPVEAALYYTVAEALTNVSRYACASCVTVRIGAYADKATVEVADDGVGGADRKTGSGLRGLADRLGALDGSLEIESAPGAGTCLRATVPLSSAGR